MRRYSILIFCLFLQSPLLQADNRLPHFYLTSSCINEVNVIESESKDDWTLELEFSDEGAEKINKFTINNLGKVIILEFEDEEHGFQNEARVQGEIFSRLHIAGMKSKNDAIKVKQALIESKGECGDFDN